MYVKSNAICTDRRDFTHKVHHPPSHWAEDWRDAYAVLPPIIPGRPVLLIP